MALKGWLAVLILLFTVGNVAWFVLDWLGDQRGLLRLLFPDK